MVSEPTPTREEIQADYDAWQVGANVDTAGRVARRVPYLLQRIRDLELAIADGLENRRLSLLPDTEREVHFEELCQQIATLERELASRDSTIHDLEVKLKYYRDMLVLPGAPLVQLDGHDDEVHATETLDVKKLGDLLDALAATKASLEMLEAKHKVIASEKANLEDALADTQADSARLDWYMALVEKAAQTNDIVTIWTRDEIDEVCQ